MFCDAFCQKVENVKTVPKGRLKNFWLQTSVVTVQIAFRDPFADTKVSSRRKFRAMSSYIQGLEMPSAAALGCSALVRSFGLQGAPH